MQIIKRLIFMGKLVPCKNNPKILCVCEQRREPCIEQETKRVDKKA